MYTSSILALEDGSLFKGYSIGALGVGVGEVVFNTSMTGYQEIVTDPSYASQIVALTYPHIGNVGINSEDEESRRLWLKGLIIRDLPAKASNWRAQQDLSSYLKQHNVVGIAGIDTRHLTRTLRDKGAMNGVIISGDQISSEESALMLRDHPSLKGQDLAKVVSTKSPYLWQEPTWHGSNDSDIKPFIKNNKTKRNEKNYHVVVYDFGVKHNILRLLVDLGCSVRVVPAQTPAEEVLKEKPDGVFLSNGPGDPEPCNYAIKAVETFLNKGIPLFGICLGHQILALASGAKTIKMKFGHHGANHPVQCLATKKVLITSQNHGFMVDGNSIPSCLTVTHRSLFDQSIQGVARNDKPAFGFQGHPEASPGPQDVVHLFAQFKKMMADRMPVA